VATVLIGALAGAWLLTKRTVGVKVLALAGVGVVLTALGWLWGRQFPIIKHIWTSSYAIYAAGWSCLLLALFYGIVDGLRWRRWGFLFLLIGLNPLVIYLLVNTKLIDFVYIGKFFFGFTYAGAAPEMRPVGDMAAAMVVEFALLYWLYRKKFFWRV
jgi:predicted acyltransferase